MLGIYIVFMLVIQVINAVVLIGSVMLYDTPYSVVNTCGSIAVLAIVAVLLPDWSPRFKAWLESL